MKVPTSLLIALCTLFTLTFAVAEADPDRLNDAIQAAAKSASFKKAASGPKSAHHVKFPPKPNPTPNLGGLGIVGGFGTLQPGPNYGAQCRKKNPKMATVINTFCSKHTPITVPSKYTGHGWCGPGEKQNTAQVDTFKHGTIVWCARIGSKKKCNPTTLPKKKCLSKLMEVCAKGGARGIGVAKDGDCYTYRTGRVDYTQADAFNPFKGWRNDVS